jgi:hypothetical protein
MLAGRLIVPSALAAKSKKKDSEKQAAITPPEDLMREHGVLDRLLLIYEAGTRKFASNEDFDPAIITGSAEIVRDFIGNSHEKSEEEAVFTRRGRHRSSLVSHSVNHWPLSRSSCRHGPP